MAKLSEVATTLRRTVADANATIASTDRLVAYTALTAARTVALPPAAAFPAATLLTIIDESGACSASNTITINRAGADTIAGGASFVLNGAYMSILLESDGVSKWTPLANDVNEAFATLGVGTAPDPANPLSVYGASALFNGANFSFTVNKSAAANVASVIFEDNFSLRAQIGLLNSDQLQIKVSPNGSSYFTGLTFDNATGAPTFGNARTAVADSNYTALTTDRVIAFTAITAARSVTLPAASAFPSGHALVIVDESGAVSATNSITIARSGSDTISGLTNATISAAYGHCRLLSNGANGWVVTGRSVNVQVFAGSGTYVPTPGMTKCEVYLVGGGGGGGGGALQAASNAASGGGGGGGAGANFGVFTAAQVGSSRIVTIGAAGTAGAAATTSGTAGGNGGQGGATQFGSLLKASGGGGGSGGQLAGASAGGGGGSTLSAGGNASGATRRRFQLGRRRGWFRRQFGERNDRAIWRRRRRFDGRWGGHELRLFHGGSHRRRLRRRSQRRQCDLGWRQRRRPGRTRSRRGRRRRGGRQRFAGRDGYGTGGRNPGGRRGRRRRFVSHGGRRRRRGRQRRRRRRRRFGSERRQRGRRRGGRRRLLSDSGILLARRRLRGSTRPSGAPHLHWSFLT